MIIDPITQYILEQDEPDNKSLAKRATLKTAKAAGYVASNFRAKFAKKMKEGKCKQLEVLSTNHARRGGSCNTAKSTYYKHLTSICKNGFKLQMLLDEINKTFIKPGTKKELRSEAQRIKIRILEGKEKMEITKKLVDEKCKAEVEKNIDAKTKKKR